MRGDQGKCCGVRRRASAAAEVGAAWADRSEPDAPPFPVSSQPGRRMNRDGGHLTPRSPHAARAGDFCRMYYFKFMRRMYYLIN